MLCFQRMPEHQGAYGRLDDAATPDVPVTCSRGMTTSARRRLRDRRRAAVRGQVAGAGLRASLRPCPFPLQLADLVGHSGVRDGSGELLQLFIGNVSSRLGDCEAWLAGLEAQPEVPKHASPLSLHVAFQMLEEQQHILRLSVDGIERSADSVSHKLDLIEKSLRLQLDGLHEYTRDAVQRLELFGVSLRETLDDQRADLSDAVQRLDHFETRLCDNCAAVRTLQDDEGILRAGQLAATQLFKYVSGIVNQRIDQIEKHLCDNGAAIRGLQDDASTLRHCQLTAAQLFKEVSGKVDRLALAAVPPSPPGPLGRERCQRGHALAVDWPAKRLGTEDGIFIRCRDGRSVLDDDVAKRAHRCECGSLCDKCVMGISA